VIRRNLEGEPGASDLLLSTIAPSHCNDAAFLEWYIRAGRLGASPASAARIWHSILASTGEEQLLGEVDVPTLVLYRADHMYVSPQASRDAAARIRHVTVVELPGADLFPFLGDVDSVVAEISQHLLGERRVPPPQRILAAVLLTDLVGSTARAASLGDARWKTVLDRHDAVIRATVGRHGGTVVKGTGDGVLALLPSASAALAAADRIRRDLAVESLQARIGIHVGDVDRRGDDISGIAAHIAARVMSVAGADEIVVTDSVVAAAGGAGPRFQPRGEHELKGVPGTWTLWCHFPDA
jgi:class 3 adenylate cyclase